MKRDMHRRLLGAENCRVVSYLSINQSEFWALSESCLTWRILGCRDREESVATLSRAKIGC